MVFNNPQNYQFVLPESMFPDVPRGEHNPVQYGQQPIVEEEDTFKPRLSP